MPKDNSAADERPIPSQSEGEVDPGAVETGVRPVPSQAEGDEETIDEDLAQKSRAKADSK
jgi:hypothetical protein